MNQKNNKNTAVEAQSTKDIAPTEKKELTPEEKYQKVRDAFLQIGKKLLEIQYPHLMKKEDYGLYGIDVSRLLIAHENVNKIVKNSDIAR